MTIEAVEFAIKNMLKEASPLAAHNGVALHRLEVAIRRVSGEYFYQPLPFRICGVTMRISFSRQIINAKALPFRIPRIF